LSDSSVALSNTQTSASTDYTEPNNEEMDFDLGCGCGVSVPKCSDGPGNADCAYETSPANERRQKQISLAKEQANSPIDDQELWPHCPDVPEKTLQPNMASPSKELKKLYVISKKVLYYD
jgi:hypothetical protein